MVLTHPWTRFEFYLGGWVETEIVSAVLVRILKAVMMGTLSVLDAHWSVISKYGGVFEFDLMNNSELSLSVTAAVGHLLICSAGTDQLLISDINPSVVTRTFVPYRGEG